MNYLFDEERCRKLKAGNEREKSGVERNHEKEKGLLSFYYKMRYRFNRRGQQPS
jgi:hypothetical protein